jgi:acetyltransferase
VNGWSKSGAPLIRAEWGCGHAFVGVLRVDSISQLFDMAEVLAKQPRPRGPKLAVVTNAGGPGVLAADALIENSGQLATLSREACSRW